MKEEDSAPVQLTSMPRVQKGRGNKICVNYSRENGFCAYGPEETAQRQAKTYAWEAQLGLPLTHQECCLLQKKLAQFTPQGRENAEICNFLYQSLLEFGGGNAAAEEGPHATPTTWETCACNCCNDLAAWLRDQEYEFMWDDWEDCIYSLGINWVLDLLLIPYRSSKWKRLPARQAEGQVVKEAGFRGSGAVGAEGATGDGSTKTG